MTRPPLDLEAIRQRVDRATPGPWYESDEPIGRTHDIYAPPGALPGLRRELPVAEKVFGRDSRFIAHAREDVPALLAEVERLRSGIETVLGLTSSPGPRAEYILRDLLGGSR